MKSETVKAIFTNLLFVIGVILIIFGLFRGTLTLTRIIVFENYPLQPYEETRCELEPLPATIVDGGKETPLSEKELKDRSEKCKANLEYLRKVKKTEDIVTSAISLIAGAALVFSFRKFIFK